MGKLRRYATISLIAACSYLSVLLGLSFALEGCAADLVEERLEVALDAEVEVGEVSLSLLRGHIEVHDVKVTREHYGHLDLSIDRVELDMAPLGWLAINRDPNHVEVASVTMLLSAGGALDLPTRPKRKPLRVGGMTLTDIQLTAAASKLLPGLGKVELIVAEARTGPVVMSSALDWVFALSSLSATAKLPAGIDAGVHYRPGELGLSGSVFGSEPITMPFTMPTPNPDALETDKLRLLGDAVVETVGKKLAKSWMKSKVKGLLD